MKEKCCYLFSYVFTSRSFGHKELWHGKNSLFLTVNPMRKKSNEHQNVFQSEESISKEFCDVFKKCTSLFRNKRFLLDEMTKFALFLNMKT